MSEPNPPAVAATSDSIAQASGKDAVRRQLDRILAHPIFEQSSRQSRFLRFIVEQTLDGKAGRLKGYTIGLEVFDRDRSFDPNTDAIVRVEAGRLRSKLNEYYQGDGRNDLVRIDLPKGSYVPRISFVEPGAASGAAIPRDGRLGSIAVLPFRNLSGDPAQDYFSDGMTDAIIAALAKHGSLKVISMTSVMRYKNSGKSLPQIARELNVTHVLEGTVLREGDAVRITGQLVEGRTDHHVWAERYERSISGIIAVQNELADQIATQLSQRIAPAGAARSPRAVNPEAYELYLLGRRYRSQFTVDGFHRGQEYFEKAVAVDPEFAPAYSGIASCLCALGSHGFEVAPPCEILPLGIANARHAIELEGDQVEPYAFLGIMQLKYEWDWPGAERSFLRAIALSPNDARSHMQYSLYLESIGRFEQATAEAELAREVDPLSKSVNLNLAWQLYQAGRDADALRQLRLLQDLAPDFWGTYWGFGHWDCRQRRYEDAVGAFRKAIELQGGHTLPYQGLGYAYAAMGDPQAARGVIDTLDRLGRTGYVPPFYYATIYAGLNQPEQCFAWLEKAYAERSRSLAWLKVTREYEHLRDDPRFAGLVRRIGIPA